jgi:hypothetical protein
MQTTLNMGQNVWQNYVERMAQFGFNKNMAYNYLLDNVLGKCLRNRAKRNNAHSLIIIIVIIIISLVTGLFFLVILLNQQ